MKNHRKKTSNCNLLAFLIPQTGETNKINFPKNSYSLIRTYFAQFVLIGGGI
jgi:hypothetical protein